LNACLDRVNELIAAATSDLVRKEDLVTQRLQEEFSAELACAAGGCLGSRYSAIGANQFSTTTKLNGDRLGLTGVSGENIFGGS